MNKIDQLLAKEYTYSQYAYNTASTTVATNTASLTAERDELIRIIGIINTEMDDYMWTKLSANDIIQWSTGMTTTPIGGHIQGYRFTTVLDSPSGAYDEPEYVNSTTFQCANDHASDFPFGTELITPAPSGSVSVFPDPTGNLIIDCGVDGTTYAYVVSAGYLTPSGSDAYTEIQIAGGTITANIKTVKVFDQLYNDSNNWDSDTYISQREAEWYFTHDHLYKTLDTSGSYGVIPRLAAATSASGLLAINKGKNDQFNTYYQRFTNWVKVLDNTDPVLPDVTYYDMVSFTCPGDLTTTFPVSGSLLMDCGVDGFKGGIISTSTFTSPSAGDYTEIVLSPDHLRNVEDTEMFMTAALTTVSVSGSIIFDKTDPLLPDAVWVDEVTFNVPGDWTSVFIADDTEDIACDCGVDGIPYFFVYSVTHKTDPCNFTRVDYLEGVPITTNITSVSVNTT